ncbi:hypothetical protein GXW83_10895 [Streptacidiphilus sp. PB12-B1b]|nr:hypothetical protein GXW83_10895 [Streptacidiphilus sp. PB12-B1b]
MSSRRAYRALLAAPRRPWEADPGAADGPATGPQAEGPTPADPAARPEPPARPGAQPQPQSRPGPRPPRRSHRADPDVVLEGPPPGVGHLRWYRTRVLDRPLAVLLHPERGMVTVALELPPASAALLADVRPYGPAAAPAAGAEQPGPALRRLLDRLARADAPLSRLQLLSSARPLGRSEHAHLVAALPLTRTLAAEAAAVDDRPGEGLALLAGRATLDLCRHLADCDISISGFVDTPGLAALIRSRYDPGQGGGPRIAEGSPWPAEIDATHHRHLRTSSGTGAAVQAQGGPAGGWYHATAWVKSWPRGADGLDLTAPLRLPRLPLPRAVAVVVGCAAGQEPTAAGYVTVSARTPAELQSAREELRRALPADAPLQLEWTDREHHLAFTHTLPLATGLAPAPPSGPAGHF